MIDGQVKQDRNRLSGRPDRLNPGSVASRAMETLAPPSRSAISKINHRIWRVPYDFSAVQQGLMLGD
jgi:hypothetical protein